MIYKFERKLKGANQVEATGEELTINNAGRKVQKFTVKGKSEQIIKMYNNLVKNADFKSDLNEWKASSKFSVVNKNGIKYLKISTSTAGFNRAYQGLNTIAEHKYYVAMKCIKDKSWTCAELFLSASLSDNYPQPAKAITNNIYQNETSVSTILVPKSSNCSIGVMLQSSNTDEVWEAYFRDFICIDLTELYGDGNEPDQTTCDNLFTFDKVAYGTSPSAYTLSQIENVGDNINVFNKTADDFKNGETIGWAQRVILTLEPNTYYTCSTNDVVIPGSSTSNLLFGGTDSKEYTVIKGYPISYKTDESGHVPIFLRQTNIDDFFANYYIKVEKGLRATPSSAYNCGSVGVTISNRNLFNPEWLAIGNLSSDDGQEFIQNNYARTKHISVEPNENLSITMFDTTNFRASALYFYDKDKNLIKRTVASSNVGWDNFSTMGNCKYIRFTIAVVGSKYPTFTEEALQEASNNLQLERGVSTSYIPHEEQEIVFPLTEGQKLRSLPNGVKDYLAEDGIHKNVGTMILNGGADEGYYKAVDNKFALGINTKKGLLLKNLKTDNSKISVLSDKLLGVSWSIMNSAVEGWQIALRQDGSYTYLRLLTTGIKDTKALETFLQNNNAIVAYPLAEEEIIPYTQEQQEIYNQLQNLKLFRGCNHITAESNIKPTIKLSYYDGELDMTDYKYNLQFKKHMQEM